MRRVDLPMKILPIISSADANENDPDHINFIVKGG